MQKLQNNELNRLSIEEFKLSEKFPIVVVLDNVRSLHNIGSIFRTSDAFSVQALFLCGITATPPHREIQKTALGATESVEWTYFQHTGDALIHLKDKGYAVFAVEQAHDAVMLGDFDMRLLQQPIALVFGNEVEGVQDEIMQMVDGAIEIPQFGTKHSLNVSVSAGIVIYELIQKIIKMK